MTKIFPFGARSCIVREHYALYVSVLCWSCVVRRPCIVRPGVDYPLYCVYIYIYTHICTYICIHVYIYIYTHLFLSLALCIYIYIYIYNTHIYVYVCVHMYVYVCSAPCAHNDQRRACGHTFPPLWTCCDRMQRHDTYDAAWRGTRQYGAVQDSIICAMSSAII